MTVVIDDESRHHSNEKYNQRRQSTEKYANEENVFECERWKCRFAFSQLNESIDVIKNDVRCAEFIIIIYFGQNVFCVQRMRRHEKAFMSRIELDTRMNNISQRNCGDKTLEWADTSACIILFLPLSLNGWKAR